jgi:hypothetical protein
MTQEKEFKILDTLPEGYDSPDDVPDCAKDRCEALQKHIDQACKNRGCLCKCYCK